MKGDGVAREREEWWRVFWRSNLSALPALVVLDPRTAARLVETGGWPSLVGGGLLLSGLGLLAWTPLPVQAGNEATGRVPLGFGLIVAAYALDECRRGGVAGGGPWIALAGILVALSFARPSGERSER